MVRKVHYCEGQNIFIKCGDRIVPVFPVYCDRQPYYSIVAGYSSTIHKVKGQTLPHATLVFNCRFLSPAVGYAALPRVSCLDNVVPVTAEENAFINY